MLLVEETVREAGRVEQGWDSDLEVEHLIWMLSPFAVPARDLGVTPGDGVAVAISMWHAGEITRRHLFELLEEAATELD
jgi:hypothetical protein